MLSRDLDLLLTVYQDQEGSCLVDMLSLLLWYHSGSLQNYRNIDFAKRLFADILIFHIRTDIDLQETKFLTIHTRLPLGNQSR